MTPVLLFILGVVFVAVGIAVSIALHEVGHLVPAKLFKVRVTKYMIGFGPTLWSRRKGETEYGVKAVPLGGYVSMIGMYPPNKEDGSVRPSSTGMFQTLATEARSQAHEEVGPGDENRVFYRLPVWKKIIVMLGGPAMNMILGLLFTAVLLMGFGVATATTTISDVSKCQVAAGQTVDPNSADCQLTPAAAAGLKPNDTVTSFDGKAVTSWDQLTEWIRASAGREVAITVQRDGNPVSTTVTPVLSARPVMGSDGRQATDAAGNLQYQDVGFLGIGAQTALVPQPASSVLPMAGENIRQVAGVVLNLPARVVGVAKAAFSEEPRDPNGPISVVGVGRVAGEVAAMEAVPLQSRVATLVGLLAGLNFALAVFNLVPLLPLDGGHVAGALYEGVRRKVAKLRGRPDPGAFDIAKLLPVTYVVAALLMGMSVLLIYADIVKPVNLFG
ncbi:MULTISPECIES: M50 family metallopeptidase [Arthrobacter]|uniref:M50 family metallopeptidase n=1 Tax=Arthrobacter TaxID=1663 RepID=UPI001EF14E54|nr:MULTISPECIES: site-2 protease family protein [Arthrobacter]MDP9988107.1 membrane-associated protease RseP (regulator of RpoE activity) [Arthrobacter oryzae]UKA72606.1 site-2 protease family protein [Arthrobacter sp. FW306-06-A]UKA76837.1 site-2 protease family protein [Arthrobacter sp. FW306-07-I]